MVRAKVLLGMVQKCRNIFAVNAVEFCSFCDEFSGDSKASKAWFMITWHYFKFIFFKDDLFQRNSAEMLHYFGCDLGTNFKSNLWVIQLELAQDNPS
jgi:hypothetical protein